MEAAKKTINDIFNRSRILEIPFFQRAYVWGSEQWERFLDDMKHISRAKKPYFFGSVILKQRSTPVDESVGDVRLLIDGQQRLTTLIIFFKVLSLKDDSLDYLFEKFMLEHSQNELAFWHNHNDRKSFERVCNLEKPETIGDVENDNILGVYQFFKENACVEDLDVKAINGNLTFISISLSSAEDEQQIFDTLNSLGVRLTTAELLKNHLFNRDQFNVYESNWKSVFEKDDETKQYWDREITIGMRRTFIDLFFYAYLQIKVQDPARRVSGKDKENFSRVENLFQSYKKFLKKYSLETSTVIAEIKEYAEIFRTHFDYDVIEKSLPAEFGIERINAIIWGLGISTLIPYTLFILKNVDDSGERRDLFGAIESYIMRRLVVRASTKNYNQLFSESMIHNRILSADAFRTHIQKSGDHLYSMPTDADFKSGFAESKLINKQSRGVLYFIETKLQQSEKSATQLLGLDRYHLEHLMPKKWETHWKLPDASQEAKDARSKILLTLGNLAIIRPSLNASIKNADWATKKSGNSTRNPGLEHYASGLETMVDCLKVDDWNEQEIENRAKDLCKKAMKIWPVK